MHYHPRVLPRALATVGALVLAALALSLNVTPVSAAGVVPPSNPLTNTQAHPNFLSTGSCTRSAGGYTCDNPCVGKTAASSNGAPVFPAYTNTATCAQWELHAINVARASEGLVPMVLPTNWLTLTAPEQLFVLADLERTARGLPPYLGLNRQLTNAAQRAALLRTDAHAAPGFALGLDPQHAAGYGSTWAQAHTTLEADFSWMYDDGWGGSAALTPNSACTWAHAIACWAHRDELLGFDGAYNPGVGLHCTTCEVGTGFAVINGASSMTVLVERPAGRVPGMYFTWASNVVPYLTTPVTN